VNDSQIRIVVDSPGGRLDQILSSSIQEFSRSRLKKIIHDGLVEVDDIVVIKPAFHLIGGEIVKVTIPDLRPAALQAECIPLDIIFENEDLVVINKPAGMVVHPSAGHESGTLVHAVLAHAPDIQGIGGERRPGVVHRLDKDTSGLILMAKNDQAYHKLQRQFSERKVEKTYLALVDGKPPTPKGRIEAAIGRDPSHRKKMAIMPPGKGRPAISVYNTLECFHDHTLLEVHPITGRTHQIRLHMAFLGCPVVGDRVYGFRKCSVDIDRHFLHAAKLVIKIPGDDDPRTFEASLPEDLKILLTQLRK
jgi:23S rRNA pseudouridine1911/1915/1917 synthase